jgi:hypothetical protein
MFFRSPRRFAIFSFVTLLFICVVLRQSPWAQEKVYERISLYNLERQPAEQELLHETHEPQAPLEDAWQHALPMPGAHPSSVQAHQATGPAKVVPPPMETSREPAPKSKSSKPYPPWVTAPSRTGSFIPPTPRPTNMKEYVKKMLKWPRPSWDGHWPPFQDYVNKAYDPNRWEHFDM